MNLVETQTFFEDFCHCKPHSLVLQIKPSTIGFSNALFKNFLAQRYNSFALEHPWLLTCSREQCVESRCSRAASG